MAVHLGEEGRRLLREDRSQRSGLGNAAYSFQTYTMFGRLVRTCDVVMGGWESVIGLEVFVSCRLDLNGGTMIGS